LEALEKNYDKSQHPIFMICSGAGTGKSRLLDEFGALASKMTSDDPILNEKIKNSYVFLAYWLSDGQNKYWMP
jgi:ABC-type lipoprotein export system ATPase subunit